MPQRRRKNIGLDTKSLLEKIPALEGVVRRFVGIEMIQHLKYFI
jgi:hypothetical protein